MANAEKLKRKNTVLGLDLGSTSVKAVEIAREGGALSVTGCSRGEVDDPAAYGECVRGVIAAGGLSTRNVVVGLGGRSTLLRTVTLPPGIAAEDADAVAEAVRAEAAKHIPYGMDEAQLDWHMLDSGREGRGARVLLAAARLSDIDDKLKMLSSAGITPSRIDVECVALANAAETAAFLPEDGRPVGIVDFGASKTLITVTDGTAHLFREFPVGGMALTEMVAQRFGCSMEKAEEIQRDPGDEIDTVKDAMYPGLEDITAEIRGCLDRFKHRSGGKETGRLLLSGGLVAFSGVTPLVGRLTRTEARVFDSFGAVAADGLDADFLGENMRSLAVAFGLACHARE